jgi:hypothetical protein
LKAAAIGGWKERIVQLVGRLKILSRLEEKKAIGEACCSGADIASKRGCCIALKLFLFSSLDDADVVAPSLPWFSILVTTFRALRFH